MILSVYSTTQKSQGPTFTDFEQNEFPHVKGEALPSNNLNHQYLIALIQMET